MLSRAVDLKLLDLFSEGKLSGTVHTCIGQEFVGATLAPCLKAGDALFSNHRCHGHYLSYLEDAYGLIAEVMGKFTGVCHGIGGSQHLCNQGFYSNGIQGGIVPVAAGLAWARKIRGGGSISVVMIGDGTLGEGILYETLNIVSKWELPLLIVCENNQYAQSTPQHETMAGSICLRPESFGIQTYHGDTWDWQTLHGMFRESVLKIRTDGRPVFIQVDTYRLKPHSKGDDNRDPKEIKKFEAQDPLNILMAQGTALLRETEIQVTRVVDEAVERASGDLPASTEQISTVPNSPSWHPRPIPPHTRLVKEMAALFLKMLELDSSVYFLGEDIVSPYGGAFKATEGLSVAFADRVLNTPISEAAIVGLATGLSLEGYRPFVEIMFGDFAGLAFDQIVNHAAKFGAMYAGKVTANIVIRTPMGGHRGYGPTHSQSLEKHFFGIAGLRIVAIHNLLHPRYFYLPLLKTNGPTLVIENKLLYSSYLTGELPAGFVGKISDEEFPTLWIRPQANRIDVTLVGYGGVAQTLLEAADTLFEEHDLVCQVLIPSQIYPWSVSPFLKVVEEARVLVVAEEGQGFSGFGAEVISQFTEASALKIHCSRVFARPSVIPASKTLEAEALPGIQPIIDCVLKAVS